MPVTELALFLLPSPQAHSSPQLLSFLNRAAAVMSAHEASTGSFRYFLSADDPSHVYLVGEWASARAHWEEFIPSGGNQELLEHAKSALDVAWMFHVDVPQNKLALDAEVVRIERWVVDRENVDAFEKALEELRSSKETSSVDWNGGWRIDAREDNKAEWAMFVGQKKVDVAAQASGETSGKSSFSILLKYVSSRSVETTGILKTQT